MMEPLKSVTLRRVSSIGGPGGVGGPRGPGGPEGPDGPDIDGLDGARETEGASAPETIARTSTADGIDTQALAAEIAAGRLSPQEAIERLVDAMAGPDLPPEMRTGVRELLRDELANDPHLQSLVDHL